MPAQKLKQFLDDQNVHYEMISHRPATSAIATAVAAHVPQHDMAKTVMVRLNGKMAMAVVPASHDVDLQRLAKLAGAKTVTLADEDEFRDLFPDCDLGAMPPFGNLYGMDVYVGEELCEDDQIAFNAGNHSELMQMSYRDFSRLCKPTIGKFAM
ncbi:YbaK / prolyl-tRNA synthetases associated domain protein [Novipirellula galeiformis]|uniref:YbaK / prolyl-tRNA synthetases associated domain protein n=1 Tax=Novipirellula galeiformis TaxID=2528004 RepID=A0A5C6CLM7_9BACT|nr:YbaK/EbsC family protein [Novipirellula galeiformis]TWU25358.1 YbaK / prolyl-tRNA synthetases associated domain protein [Novipirellula galeiformis]